MKQWINLIFIIISIQSANARNSTVNDEALLKSLITSGVICSELSYPEQQKALQIYLKKKSSQSKHKKPTQSKPPPAAKMPSKQTPSPFYATEGTECIKP
jgi:hypothetical protein